MHKALKQLMQGLYLPAFLGTGLVLVMLRIMQHDGLQSASGDMDLYWGVVLSVFFSMFFLAVQLLPDSLYSVPLFVVEMLEVVFMFLLFYALGLFSTDQRPPVPNYQFTYFIAILATVNPLAWNWLLGVRARTPIYLGLVSMIVFGLGALWGYQFVFCNLAILVFMAVLLAIYIAAAFRHAETASHHHSIRR